MRYAFVVIFFCAAGMTAAAALPAINPHAVSGAKAKAIEPVVKRNRPPAHRHGRADGGIHPLVGSGNY